MCVWVLIPYLSTEFNSVWKRSSFLTDGSLRSARISDIKDRNHLSTAPGINPNGNTSRRIGHIDISISFMPPNSVGWKIFRPISRNSDLTSVKHCGSMLNEQRITFWVANREASYNQAQKLSKWHQCIHRLARWWIGKCDFWSLPLLPLYLDSVVAFASIFAIAHSCERCVDVRHAPVGQLNLISRKKSILLLSKIYLPWIKLAVALEHLYPFASYRRSRQTDYAPSMDRSAYWNSVHWRGSWNDLWWARFSPSLRRVRWYRA